MFLITRDSTKPHFRGRFQTMTFTARIFSVALALLSLVAVRSFAVEHAMIDVVENDTGNTTASVTVTKSSGTPGFAIATGSNRGDYEVAIQNPGDVGFDRSNDFSLGIMLTSVMQNVIIRNESGIDVPYTGTSAIHPRVYETTNTGSFYIPVFKAPSAGVEYNTNVSAVYFPFDEGWYAGHAYPIANEAGTGFLNGAVLDNINGPSGSGTQAPAIVVGTDFIDLGTGGAGTGQNGTYELFVPGVEDTRRQGLLFVTHGKNEDNYASSSPSTDGSRYRLFTKGNNTNGTSTERDPIAFAFIPLGTPGVIMGRVGSSALTVLGSGNFNVSPVADEGGTFLNGVYRLEIPGHSTSSGTLLLSPENLGSGGSADNMVTAEPTEDGTAWIINVRDLPNAFPVLESVFNTAAFNFAFFPNEGAASAPGAIKPLSDFEFDFTLSSVVGANVTVVENTPLNVAGDNSAFVATGTAGMYVPYVDRGDISVGQGGDFFHEDQGVMFATIRQNHRDNSATGGHVDGGVAGTSIQHGNWMVHTATASGNPGLNAEHNIDFAAVVFQTNSGFQTATNRLTVGGMLDVIPGTDIMGVTNPTNEGVLMVGAYGNDDNYATVSVLTNVGTGDPFWAIDIRDNQGTLEQTGTEDGLNYVWLPFNTPGLVAGRIAGDGTIIASTQDGGNPNFTLTRTEAGLYELLIPDVTPDDGMLLLNGALANPGILGHGGSIMSYEAALNGSNQDVFLIQNLGVVRQDNGDGTFTSLYTIEDGEFSFAYIDFGIEAPEPGLLAGDYNNDGVVNAADYVLWRDTLGSNFDLSGNGDETGGSAGTVDQADYALWAASFGNTNLGSGAGNTAVPEPTTLCLFAAAGLGLALIRRQRGN